VSRRDRFLKNETWSKEQLDDYRAKLAALQDHELEHHYQANHNACRSIFHLPSPSMVQQFVQAWKELRRRRKRFLKF
jgi:hypothetical protein